MEEEVVELVDGWELQVHLDGSFRPTELVLLQGG